MKTFILYQISEFIRSHNFCLNIGKFKIGDKVTYNWRAKYQLSSEFVNFKDVYEVSGYYDGAKESQQNAVVLFLRIGLRR